MDAGLYELLFTQKRTSFSQFSSQGSSVTLYVPFGGTVSYVPLATHILLPEKGNGNKTWVGECIRREETLFKQTLKEMACVKKYPLSACLTEKAGFGNGKAGAH